MPDDIHSIELSIGNLELAVAGSEEFVEEQFFKLYENHKIEDAEYSVESDTQSNNNGNSSNSADGDNTGGQDSTEYNKTLNEYLADSEASTYQDNALVVGWYLEYATGQDDFTAPEVSDKAHNDKVELGTKVRRDLDKNISKGYLHSPGERDGANTYWVTDSGEEYLNELGIPIQ